MTNIVQRGPSLYFSFSSSSSPSFFFFFSFFFFSSSSSSSSGFSPAYQSRRARVSFAHQHNRNRRTLAVVERTWLSWVLLSLLLLFLFIRHLRIPGHRSRHGRLRFLQVRKDIRPPRRHRANVLLRKIQYRPLLLFGLRFRRASKRAQRDASLDARERPQCRKPHPRGHHARRIRDAHRAPATAHESTSPSGRHRRARAREGHRARFRGRARRGDADRARGTETKPRLCANRRVDDASAVRTTHIVREMRPLVRFGSFDTYGR